MGVRNESVRLSLQDDGFTTTGAKAAAIIKLLESNLNDLDGSSVRANRSTSTLGSGGGGLNKTEVQARKTDQSINQLTGRIRVLADIAAIAGPTIAPLGAAAVPGLAAMATQATVAGGALGVTVLAVTGLGDALEALNAYQLEPTAENLAAMRTEMEKVGPDAASFLRYIDALEPQLRALQQTARAGMFPGFEDGIDELLTQLPEVRNLVAELATASGGLAADAGKSLAGPEWETFFTWLENRGGPILDEFGRTIGNFANGIANLLVAFDPAAQDFSSGLLEMSRSFAEWSRGLDSNRSFQEFLAYVRESGPQALDLIGSLIDMLAEIVTAAAPIGSAVLPVFTKVADILATIAGSDLGTPILAGVAALSAYNRVMAVTEATQKRLNATGGLLGTNSRIGASRASLKEATTSLMAVTSAQDRARLSSAELTKQEAKRTAAVRAGLATIGKSAAVVGGLAVAGSGAADSIGLTNTASLALMGTMAGPWGAAIGGAVGFTMDLANANDDVWEAIERVRNSMAAATPTPSSIAQVTADLDEAVKKYDEFRDRVDKGGAPQVLKNVFTGDFGTAGDILKNDTEDLFGRSDVEEQKAAIAELRAEQEKLRGSMSFVNMSAGQQQAALLAAADAARTEADVINGDLISAMRALRSERLRNANAELNYKSAILDAQDALKENGQTVDDNTRAGQANLQSLYSLAEAWNGQSDAAKNASGSLSAARGNFVQVATAMGMSEEKARNLAKRLFEIPSRRVTVEVDGISAAINGVSGLSSQIRNLQDRTVWITTRYKRVGSVTDALPDRGGTPRSADGTTVPKTGRGYADRHLYLLADGEEVISNRYGQADRHRSLLKRINANQLADGGTTGDNDKPKRRRQMALVHNQWTDLSEANSLGEIIKAVSGGLRGMNRDLRALSQQVRRSEDSVERERTKRDALQSQFDELSGRVSGGLRSDIFAAPDNIWAAGGVTAEDRIRADIAAGEQRAGMIGQLSSKGLTGAALDELLSTNDASLIAQYAGKSAAELAVYSSLYNQRETTLSAVGRTAGDAAYGQALEKQTEIFDRANSKLDRLNESVNGVQKAIREAERGRDTAKDAAKAVKSAVAKGAQRKREKGGRR